MNTATQRDKTTTQRDKTTQNQQTKPALLRSRIPTAFPAAAYVAVLVGLALLGIAVVAGREFLIEKNAIAGAPWVRNGAEWIGRLTWQSWMLPTAIAAAVLGALLLLAALKPRAKTHVPLQSAASIWLRPTDVARMCTARTLTVGGVLRANTAVGRRRAVVRVYGDASDAAELAGRVRAAVQPSLEALGRDLRLKVKITSIGVSR